MASKEKFLFLEPLRGVFALVVVVVHGDHVANSSYILNDNIMFSNGTMLVDLFFQLSGFVIAYSYADRVHNLSSAAAFQFNRFLRMYPLHLVTFLAFAVGFPLMEYFFELISGRASGFTPFHGFEVSAFFNNIFLTQGILEEHLNYNYPSWSVSVEFFTYLTFAIAFTLLPTKTLRIYVSVLIVIISGLALHLTDSRYPETGMALFRCTYSFFIGVLLFYVYSSFTVRVAPIFVYISFIVMFAVWYFGHYFSSLVTPFTYSFIFLSLLWSEMTGLKKFLCHPKLVFLGTVSYGIYMIHAAVWYIMGRILMKFFDYQMIWDTKNGNPHIDTDPTLATILLVVGTCITIFLAHLSYKYLEMPFNRHAIKMSSVPKKTRGLGEYPLVYKKSDSNT